jgi:cell division protein FtsQ
MWDNPVLLRSLADALLASCVLAVLIGGGMYAMNLPEAFPLRSVSLSTAPQNVMPEQVLQVLRAEMKGNLLTVNIDQIRRSLEQLPWIRRVTIRRGFPDHLVLQIEEHKVLARWNGISLVNLQGEVFAAHSDQILPNFTGPEGTSAEVTQRYAEFSKQLETLGLQVTQLALSPRHAWQMRLGNGIVLELGREDVLLRLARFVAVYPYSIRDGDSGHASEGNVAYVDLRYRNGFSVKRAATQKG